MLRLFFCSSRNRDLSRNPQKVHRQALQMPHPPHEPPFANGLATILPLPFPRGEGRGEGSFSVERSRVQCANLSGNSLPEGEAG